MIIEWVLLIQIRFCKLLWVLGGEKKWSEKNPFWDFSDDQLWLFNFHPISQNWNILISTHPFAKLKIVLESLGSGEDMVKNPFKYFDFFTSENPCDSSPPPRRNHEPPRRNFWNMGFHFLTPIFHFLLKPEPNARLVSYSMITHTWSWKTHFDKNWKKILTQNAKTQLSLSKLSFDKKYWLNFLKLPLSSRHRRPKTRNDLPYKRIFLLPSL